MNSLRSIWNQMPAVRLLIPFIAGIGLYISLPERMYFLSVAGIILLVSLSVIIYVNVIISVARIYKWRYASGTAIFAVMLSLGFILTFFHTSTNDPHDIDNVDKEFTRTKATYTGIISDPTVLRDKTVSVLIQLQKGAKGDTSIGMKGNVLASIVKDSLSETLQYGDKIIFSGVIMEYEEPKNPDQFDYKNYQSLHHIYQRVYLRDGEWKVTAVGQANPLLAQTYRARSYFLSLIKQTVTDTNALAVATAIMLGYRDYVTDEVMQAYAGSGVLHILSVSGLHVAVLFYVLNILLGWMDKKRKLKIMKGILVIIIMLFYAGITGLSPPVLRSVWMFALIITARLLNRDVSMYNVLAVSCLVLLIWDPYFIADVGFQLSYIAVAGIVYLYPMLHSLLPLPSFDFKRPFHFIARILTYLYDFIWGLVCVSISAQIATFPISLYYFHTFPNFFLLSNLLVIPLSNFVLISGMVLFAVGWCHTLLIYAGWIFDHLLIILNKIVFWVDALPFALTRGTVISPTEMLLCYITIIMVCWFIGDRRAKVLLATLSCALILCTAFSMSSIKKDNTQKLMVYSVPGKKAIAFIIRRQVYYDFDSALIRNEMLMRYNIRDHWWSCGVEKQKSMDSVPPGHKISFGAIYAINDKHIIVIDKNIDDTINAKLQVDIVILSYGARCAISDITRNIDFKEIVFDSSNKPSQIKRWVEDCKKIKIKYHDCGKKAFEIDL